MTKVRLLFDGSILNFKAKYKEGLPVASRGIIKILALNEGNFAVFLIQTDDYAVNFEEMGRRLLNLPKEATK